MKSLNEINAICDEYAGQNNPENAHRKFLYDCLIAVHRENTKIRRQLQIAIVALKEGATQANKDDVNGYAGELCLKALETIKVLNEK